MGFAHMANAAVLFYRQTLNVVITGGGRVMTRNFAGFTLIDSSNGDVVFVSADVKSKRFKVEQPDHSISTVQVPNNNTRTVLQIKSGAGEGLNAKGVNNFLNVGTAQPVQAPNTFVATGCDAYVPPGLTTAYLFEYHGALIFDKADTVSANQSNATLASASDQVRSILVSKGYTEE